MSRTFTNWAGNQTCTPAAWAVPATEVEVAALVKAAFEAGRKVKVVGAGHSFSDIALTEGVLVSLDKLNRKIVIDPHAGIVRFQAGIRLGAFNEAIAAHGLTLPIVGSIAEQSLGGLIATATHGSSLKHGNLATQVLAMRVVTGNGEILALHQGDPRLAGARVNLGALGIVTDVTLKVEPMFSVVEETVPMGFEAALDAFPGFAEQNEYAKLWWLPHTDAAQLFRGNRTKEPTNISGFARWIDASIVNAWVFPLVLWLGNTFPALIATFNLIISRVYFKAARTIGPPARVLGLAMPPRHFEAEWAIPLEECAAVMRQMRDLANSLHVNFILEARLVRADQNWMSPAYGRDTVQIGTYITNPADKDAFFAGAAAIFANYGGRPHWGKENALTLAEATVLYPRFGEFRDLVKTLDPSGTFRNAALDRLLGPVGESA